MRSSQVCAIVVSLLPLASVAEEVRCTDISGDNLKFEYELNGSTGTLQISLPAKIGEAIFHSLRADYGRRKKVSFWLDAKTNNGGEVLALIGVPSGHELLELQAVYHYPQCYSLLEAKFSNGKRTK